MTLLPSVASDQVMVKSRQALMERMREGKERTLFASFKPFSHKPLATYALLRLMRRPCGKVGLRTVLWNTRR
jgi:hypothetical protein